VLRVLTVLRVVVLLVPFAQGSDERVIAGRVVDAGGKPVGGVIVVVSGAVLFRMEPSPLGSRSTGPPRVLTAADGRFAFRHLPDGSFDVTATKQGYADGAYGRRRPSGSPKSIVLSAAQPSADVTIPIWKNGAISGTLTDEAGESVVGAQVRVCKASFVAGARRFLPAGQPAFTDDRGAYRFSNLLPGDYIVAVSAPRGSLTVSAVNSVAQTGRGGGGAGILAAMPGLPTAITVGDVSYSVGRGSIVPPPVTNGRLMVYPPTYYPAALSPSDAAIVTLASGEERSGIDVQVQPVATARVAGVLVGPDGPVAGAAIHLRPAGSVDAPLPQNEDVIVALTDLAGQFVFAGVPTGPYVLRGFETSARQTEFVEMPVSVGSDIDGLVATMRTGLQVSARTVFLGAANPPAESSYQAGRFMAAPFALEPVDGSTAFGFANNARITDSGLTLGGYASGRYFIRVLQSPPGWMFKSAVINGVDVSDTPFELTRDVPDLVITFTDRWSGLGGIVHDASGTPDTAANVVVFPANADAWRNYGATPRRLKSGATNAKGEFGISSLPPGDYYAVAIPEDQSDDWRDPKTLYTLARLATAVTILEGEHRMIDLRTKEVPR